MFSQTSYAYVIANKRDCSSDVLIEIEERQKTMVRDIDGYWAGTYVQFPSAGEHECPKCKKTVDFEWYDNTGPSSSQYACGTCKTIYIEVD